MAYPKALKEIAARLARIEEKLGIEGEPDVAPAGLNQPKAHELPPDAMTTSLPPQIEHVAGFKPEDAPEHYGDEGDEAGDLSAYDLTDAQLAALQEAGFHTTADIAAASDDDLMDVDGIGKATVRKLRS